jgi:hypothetical protein
MEIKNAPAATGALNELTLFQTYHNSDEQFYAIFQYLDCTPAVCERTSFRANDRFCAIKVIEALLDLGQSSALVRLFLCDHAPPTHLMCASRQTHVTWFLDFSDQFFSRNLSQGRYIRAYSANEVFPLLADLIFNEDLSALLVVCVKAESANSAQSRPLVNRNDTHCGTQL